MHPTLQKTLAAAGGVIVVLVFFNWAFVGSSMLVQLVDYKYDVPSAFAQGDAVYKKFGDIYTAFSVVGLSLVAGLSFAVIFWERRPPQHRIQIIYWSLLVVIVPLSFLNFWSSDTFVSRKQQAVLDLAQSFLSCICLLGLVALQLKSTEARVLRAFAVFLLAAQGVFIPGLFAIVWFLNWEGAISLATSRDISPGWITLAATFASLAVSALQYRISARKEQAEVESGSPIIQP